MNAVPRKLGNIDSLDSDLYIGLAMFFIVFWVLSEFVTYLVCLLIPAYFTYRCLKDRSHDHVQKTLLKYWICYGILSRPLKFLTDLFLGCGMVSNLVQIIFFSNLYHPKSQLLEKISLFLNKVIYKFDLYLRSFGKGFLEGFDAGIIKKNDNI